MNTSAFVTPLSFRPGTSLNISSNRTSHHRAYVTPSRWRMQTKIMPAFKQALLERLEPLDFGRKVVNDKEQKDEIEQLIKQVEATNPSKSPGTDPNLTAVWDLIYTSSDSILGSDRLPFLRPDRIVQDLNGEKLTGRNVEYITIGPFRISTAINAELMPVSPFRFDVNFVNFNFLGFININVEKNDRFTGWLEVTYLDEDLRISRGNRGNVFVLVNKK